MRRGPEPTEPIERGGVQSGREDTWIGGSEFSYGPKRSGKDLLISRQEPAVEHRGEDIEPFRGHLHTFSGGANGLTEFEACIP